MRLRAPLLLVILLSGGAIARADEDKPLPKAELDKLLAQTDEIAGAVSGLRALPIKKPIPRGVMSRDEIIKRLILRLDEDYAPGEIVIEERALKRMGLMPPEMDYRQTVLDVLAEQIAGFYDPQAKELYLADWIDPSMQKIVMAHEIDHALQDQAFDLVKFVKPDHENGDEQLARQALVEGDGVALMIEYLFREQGMKVDPWASDAIANAVGAASTLGGGKQLDKAPLFLREMLLFPYRDGLRLIGGTRKTRPWSDIDAMYARPPLSTEQVMHPDKYRAGEKPVALKLPPLPSLKSWKRPYFNVIGELGWSVFLRQHGIEPVRAEKAAAGWGGDRVMLFAPTAETSALDEHVLIDLSVWDAEIDATEAFEATADALPALAKATAPADKSAGYLAVKDPAGNVSFVERKGRAMLLVIGAPPALAPKLRSEAWATWGKPNGVR